MPILKKNIILLFGLFLLTCAPIKAQIGALNDIKQKYNQYAANTAQEKLYAHLDRNYYLAGETIWFKIYLTNGASHQLSGLSKTCYLEVLNSENDPVLQTKVALDSGMANGNLYLPLTLKTGTYKVRAYTNWMKNADPGFFFHKPITIVNTFVKPDISLADTTKTLQVQFFPEGGNLVEGIKSKIAYRAVDSNGKGIDFNGLLLNGDNDTLASFAPAQFGIGTFYMTPLKNTEYKTVIITANDTIVNENIPVPVARGYVMEVKDTTNSRLSITVNSNLNLEEYLYLLIHTNEKALFAEGKKTENGNTTFLVDKSSMGKGISHITIFNYQKAPVCERLYFTYPSFLSLKATPDKKIYTPRESMQIQLKIDPGQDISDFRADLSMAVFKLDDLNTVSKENISTYFWLTSDLKGHIESPEYYFKNVDLTVKAAMDNLMLTHGWSRFKWNEILYDSEIANAFIPEYEGHIVKYLVTKKGIDKPVAHVPAYLSVPGKFGQLYGARSNENGELYFSTKSLFGKREVVVQSNPHSENLYEFKLISPFSDQYATNTLQPPILSDQFTQTLTNRHKSMQSQNLYWSEERNTLDTTLLEQKPFYDYADKTYFLDDYTRFPTMEEVMREYVTEVIVRKKNNDFYYRVVRAPQEIHPDNPLVLFNNIPVFNINSIIDYNPLNIQKIDIVKDGYILSGGISVRGIVSYHTYDGAMHNFEIDPNALKTTYDGLSIPKLYYIPMYGDNVALNSPKPDFRNLLYWNPSIEIKNKNVQDINLYSSDLSGRYIGVIQGISNSGQTGYSTFELEIREPVN